MALSKIQAESMNLADTYAFSGTVSGTSVAGSNAFSATFSSSGWATANDLGILPYNDVSTGDCFDTDSVYNTTTYKFVAPATGVYMFWYAVYTAQNDNANGFSFLKNTAKVNMNISSNEYYSYVTAETGDHIQQATIIIPLASGDTMAHCSAGTNSDYHKSLSKWGGCRLA